METITTKIVMMGKSRTFWLLIALFVINAANPIKALFPTDLIPWVDALLTTLAVYCHLNPSQNYTSVE